MSRKKEENSFETCVAPLDELQFDHEEVSVPIVVELRRKDAEVPTKSHKTSACYDLKSLDKKTIRPGKRAFFDLGLAFKIKKGWMLHIYNRSGLSLVKKIVIPGTPKIIDSDFRGNVFICLENRAREKKYTVRKKDRIAQMSVVRDYSIDFHIGTVDPAETERGKGKLGSTGR